MKYIIIISLFFSSLCFADETYIKYGLGVFKSAENNPTEVKSLALGNQHSFFNKRLLYQYEMGGFSDTRSDVGRYGSIFGNLSTGINVENNLFYVNGLFGIGVISNPDAYLGYPVQFTEELGIGIKGSNGNKFGISYRHFSSAGIFQPNIGRDLLFLRFAIEW